MDKCGVYTIECRANGTFYIGSSVALSRRWYQHRQALKKGKHHSPYLQNCWNKYGEGEFSMRVLEDCDRLTLIQREQAYIDAFEPALNICLVAGSRVGVPHSAEVRQKISSSLKGIVRSAEHQANLSASLRGRVLLSLRGRKRPPEVIAKIVATRTGVPRPPDIAAKVAAAVRASLKGKELSPEHRAKLSAAQTGRVHSPETRAKMSASAKRNYEINQLRQAA